MKRGKGRGPTNPMPRIFRWSNGFSSAIVRHCAYLRSRRAGTLRANFILLVQWFLINLYSLWWLSRSPGEEHFSSQKYFAGPMVSHRSKVVVEPVSGTRVVSISCARNISLVQWFLIALYSLTWLPAVPVSGTSRAKNILLVQWFLIGWGPDCIRGYVGSILEMQGLGCSSPRFARAEDRVRSSRSKVRPLKLVQRCWGFGTEVA